MNSYGFSYAILKGEIPYVHFNTITTPLYAYVMAIGLIFWNNYTMILLEQTLLVTLTFYFLNEIYGKKAYVLLLLAAFFGMLAFNATYNFFVFFFLVVLLYLEKKHPDWDYWIGFVLGLSVLAKHTVGGLFLIPGLFFYWKSRKKFLRRLSTLCGVAVIFLIYLLITGSFSSFCDLCIFGLFDFLSQNGHASGFCFSLSLILFCFSFFLAILNRHDISNWYLLMGISFVIPLFDFAHLSLYILCIGIQVLPFLKYQEDYFGFLGFGLSVLFSILTFFSYKQLFSPVFNDKISHFEYILDDQNNYKNNLKYFEFFDSYPNSVLLKLGKMEYDIARERNIDYFDIFMYGNYGYHGDDKIIQKIEGMHNIYIIVDMAEYQEEKKDSQFNKVVAEYVINHYKKVDSKYIFDVYYKD